MSDLQIFCLAAPTAAFLVWLGAFVHAHGLVRMADKGAKFSMHGNWYYLIPEGDSGGDLYGENTAYRHALSRAAAIVGESAIDVDELRELQDLAAEHGNRAWTRNGDGAVVDEAGIPIAMNVDYDQDLLRYLAAINPAVLGDLAGELIDLRAALADPHPAGE